MILIATNHSSCINTVGELRSGVTGFATIYATGSHRFMLQVRNDERDEFNLIQKTGCYHWLMHVIISPLNTIELCRTFRWDVATTKRQILTLEVKNLRNNKKNQQFRILTKIDDSDGHVAADIYPYSCLAYIHDVRSPMLPLISEWFPISSA